MIKMTELDWTHKDVKITDIRKLNDFYIFTTEALPEEPLMVKSNIFEERIKTYFLRDVSRVTREDILALPWNMYITKGYYVKILQGEAIRHDVDTNKYYVSYLEIAGPLGTFSSICKEKEKNY